MYEDRQNESLQLREGSTSVTIMTSLLNPFTICRRQRCRYLALTHLGPTRVKPNSIGPGLRHIGLGYHYGVYSITQAIQTM